MIGNDIVDLNLARKSSRWQNDRFLHKVCSPAEQNLILNSGDNRFNLIWRLWSMKESAYKIYIQQGHKPCYAPSKIDCQIHSSSTGIVTINDQKYRTISKVNNNYIFSYSVLAKEKPAITKCVRIMEDSLPIVQKACYEKALEDYALLTGIKKEYLKINKCSVGIPSILNNNQLTNVSISLTHHGHYFAYSMIL